MYKYSNNWINSISKHKGTLWDWKQQQQQQKIVSAERFFGLQGVRVKALVPILGDHKFNYHWSLYNFNKEDL